MSYKELQAECIERTGAIDRNGYGRKLGKCTDGKSRPKQAHRLEWEKHHGAIPPGLYVLHRCNNKRCVNVEHLKLGTHLENSREAARDGLYKAAKGEAHGLHKLSEKDVRTIKSMIGEPDYSDTIVARIYGVSSVCIRDIRIGRTWKHIEAKEQAK